MIDFGSLQIVFAVKTRSRRESHEEARNGSVGSERNILRSKEGISGERYREIKDGFVKESFNDIIVKLNKNGLN